VEAAAATTELAGGAVATLVDRTFINNLPLKDRTFQNLLLMTPGFVSAPNDITQISANGLRTTTNYFTVDGVAANIGVSVNRSGSAQGIVDDTFSGSVAGYNQFGYTNSMISMDALDEFKVQTSTFAAEFGRTPGAQVQLTSRSGSNQYHGTAYDYLKNNVLNALSWFDKNPYDSMGRLKSEAARFASTHPILRQNMFGTTLGGPIIKDRTFFFFSYEGSRLSSPAATSTGITVPALRLRKSRIEV
jgi:hypothetical protein